MMCWKPSEVSMLVSIAVVLRCASVGLLAVVLVLAKNRFCGQMSRFSCDKSLSFAAGERP